MARVILFFSFIGLLSYCKSDSQVADTNQNSSDRKIARVFDRDIYLSELLPYTLRDSAFMVSAYIDKVVQEEAIVKKANEKAYPMDEIDMRTNQFRNSLIMIEFQKEFFKNHVDTNITENDLKVYYGQNSKPSILSEDIFKGYFIKIPVNTPKIEKLKELMASKKPMDYQELKSFCLRYANTFIINTDSWSVFPKNPEILRNDNFQNILQIIRTKQVITNQKEDHLYLVRLFDYKQSGQASPFEYCKPEIKMLVLNKRKIQAWSKYKDQLLKEAQSNKNIEIYQ
ncbi:MAG: hypothetical protein H7329_18530 [Opitutaceae bacterium]|nr:hypothetical protein [Cytophagales bacterium]